MKGKYRDLLENENTPKNRMLYKLACCRDYVKDDAYEIQDAILLIQEEEDFSEYKNIIGKLEKAIGIMKEAQKELTKAMRCVK